MGKEDGGEERKGRSIPSEVGQGEKQSGGRTGPSLLTHIKISGGDTSLSLHLLKYSTPLP